MINLPILSVTSVFKDVLLIILPIIAIVAIIYLIYILKKISKATDKVDRILDDLIYKGEVLNKPVEITSKVFNYVDIFEMLVNKNTKAAINVLKKNSDLIYKVIDTFKKQGKDNDFKTTIKNKKNKKG